VITLTIAYPHSDAACLLNNGTVGVVFPLRLPKVVPVKKMEVLLAPPCSFPVLTAIFSDTFPTTVQQKRKHPPSPSFPSYQGSSIVTRSLLMDVICLIG
jgi:hypothetical protein